MLRRLIQILLLLLFIANANAWAAAEDQPLGNLIIEVGSETSYNLKAGKNAGELVLEMGGYPRNLLDQLEKQFNRHFIAIKVDEQSPAMIRLKLIVIPVGFEFKHQRTISPHRILITLLPPPGKQVRDVVPDIPPLPFWEMFTGGTVILPDADYRSIDGSGGDHRAFLSAVRLFEIGAYDAALINIRTNLKETTNELWAENLMLLGEVLFRKAMLENSGMDEARRALILAEQEAADPVWKSRALLMIGYASYADNLLRDARKNFAAGIRSYPDLAPYFLLGQLQIAVKRFDREEAQALLKRIAGYGKLNEDGKRMVCFADVMLQASDGEVAEANQTADRCLAMRDRSFPLAVGHMLILAEARLLSHRFGEAKNYLDRIVRDYPDHVMASLAALRTGDVLSLEKRFDKSLTTYQEVARRWPKTPFGRLASLRSRELHRQLSGEANVLDIFSELDLHHEPEPVGREVRLRLMWNFENMGRYDQAYLFLVELMRRYNGIHYWPFSPERLSSLVVNAYLSLGDKGEYLTMISQYQAQNAFPLSHATQDKIAGLVADAYGAIGQLEGRIQTYLDALNREGRPVDGERSLLLGLTQAYLDKGDLYRASKTQEYFIAHFNTPEDQLEYYFLKGEIEQERGQMDAALSAFEKAMSMVDSASGRQSLGLKIGRVFYFKNAFEKAVNSLQPALAYLLDPNVIIGSQLLSKQTVNAVYFLADSYVQLGQWENALAVYHRALKLFPEDPRAALARYYVARSLIRLGRYEEAAAELEILKNVDDRFWRQVGSLTSDVVSWYAKHNMQPY